MNQRVWVGLCLACFPVVFAGCGQKVDGVEKGGVEEGRPVEVAVVSAVPVWDEEEVVGSVEAAQKAVLSAKVTGVIEAIKVTPGSRIVMGETLATIDAREMHARLNQTEVARDQAQKDFARVERLLKSGSATQQEFDAAAARLHTADAVLSEARTMLKYTEIVAPFDGVVTRKLVEVGDLASPGKPLFEVENASLLRFESEIPEALIDRIAMGSDFPVRVEAADAQMKGIVSEVAPSASAGSRTFLVKLDLPASPGLRAGQFGRVRIPVKERSALFVPSSAVVHRGQIEMVFFIRDSMAKLQPVKTGRVLGERVEILSGLSGGEKIVVKDAHLLMDGMRVEVHP